MNEKLLEVLESNCNLPIEQIALLSNMTVEEAAEQIEQMKAEKIILGNKSIINWEKTDKEFVTALIELKVTPQRGEGFDRIAERIYQFPEVKSLYLMAGSYDFAAYVTGKTMQEVAMFVSRRLSTIESVIATSTHFLLKKYKESGINFIKGESIGDDHSFDYGKFAHIDESSLR